MVNEIERVRRYYADEICAYSALQSEALVDALASVPREKYLNPGPWLIRGYDADMGALGRRTPDSDPRRVYHNVAIAIDPARLYEGCVVHSAPTAARPARHHHDVLAART